jgi:hypothetical protein
VAIQPATKFIIAHTGWNNPNIILILAPDGSLKGAYTYANSFYNINGRNLLLGYESIS